MGSTQALNALPQSPLYMQESQFSIEQHDRGRFIAQKRSLYRIRL